MKGFQRLRACPWVIRALLVCGGWCIAPAARAEDWIQLKTPHFTVISEASEGRTRDWAVQFELFRRALMMVMPVDPAYVDPVTLVLFRSDRRLRPFKPLEKGKPAAVAGFFVRLPARNTIAVAIEGARDDVREVVFHEAVHWHLTAAGRSLPMWVEEGLAEVMGNFRLSGNSFVLGSPRPEYIRFIKVAKPLALERMLELDDMQFNGKHGSMAQVFYCQSWVLMHSLVIGSGLEGVPKFAAFLEQPPSDRGFLVDAEAHLGLTSEDMQRRFKEYMGRRKFDTLTYPFDRSSVDHGFVVSAPPPGAVDMALGTLLSGSGRGSEAEPYFYRAIVARPDDARAHEGLGICSLAAERLSDARTQFQTAAGMSNASFLAHAMLAELELRAAMTFRLSFGEPDLSVPLMHLHKAFKLNPRFQPACELLGAIVAMQKEVPSGEVRDALHAAAKRFPKSVRVLLGLAHAQLRTGDRTGAQATAAALAGLGPVESPELAKVVKQLQEKVNGTALLDIPTKKADLLSTP